MAARLSVPEEYLLFGNGASELFMAIVHGLQPRRILLPVPSFYGYEYAAEASGGETVYHLLREQEGFLPGEGLLEALTEDVDLLFLANPNNPTGRLPGREYLRELVSLCKRKGITVVLEECFIEFCGGGCSMLPELGTYGNLLIVRAYTKIYAIPGVRLGYLLGSDPGLLEKVGRHLPEWNLSVFAQEAGIACAGEQEFVEKTAEFVREERRFLTDGLRRMGLRVFPGDADFILVRSERQLYRELLRQGILIRDCGNFRGLCGGFYRIAVKGREENEALLRTMERITGKNM